MFVKVVSTTRWSAGWGGPYTFKLCFAAYGFRNDVQGMGETKECVILLWYPLGEWRGVGGSIMGGRVLNF